MRGLALWLAVVSFLSADGRFYNEYANIVPQCYTKTEDSHGVVHNPCLACHKTGIKPNSTDDAYLQEVYAFPQPALKNRWRNLFKDRRKEIAAISDAQITAYVNESNYDKEALQKVLQMPKKSWDANGNGKWDGYVPDAYFSFNDAGFDRAPDGNYTGWRAFAYYPFLGTFWPTNGSSDDVMIRLPEIFRTKDGQFDKDIYSLNLSITEAMVKQSDVLIDAVDEKRYGVDLDRDGKLDSASKIAYRWSPKNKLFMSYVGDAKRAFEEGSIKMAGGLYPVGAEFLHSVRYIGADSNKTGLGKRMKELRYGKKYEWINYGVLHSNVKAKNNENRMNPDDPERYAGNFETGVENGAGWKYQAFIEDKAGNLRPQNNEEMLFCMGCHSNIGATVDNSFSFHRKIDGGFRNGWYHWSQKDLRGMPDRLLTDGRGEYATYLLENRAGDEFRENEEVMHKFFVSQSASANLVRDPKINTGAFARLKEDIGILIYPSVARALQLNKAYFPIVQEQSFLYGREATVKPSANVFNAVKAGAKTGIAPPFLLE